MSELSHFVEPIAGFHRKPAPFMVEAFAWYLQEVKEKDRFTTADIASCFDDVHITRPSSIASVLSKLCERRPPRVIRDPKGYRLHADARRDLGALLPVRATSVKVTKLLTDLLGRVTDPVQKAFLAETLVCFKHHAYRSTVVMAWNLAYNDVVDRIFRAHLSTFNGQLGTHNFKKVIAARSDFENLKESDVIKIGRAAGILSRETAKTLTEKLDKRNTAAHPTAVIVSVATAEEVVFDLVENILLRDQL